MMHRTITCNTGMRTSSGGNRLTQKQSLELEWQIVGNSIDPDELAKVRALRDAVKDLDVHQACARRPLSQQAQTLTRFLRGREGNVKAAEKMFRDSMEWRASMDIDKKIANWKRELLEGLSWRAQLVKKYGTDSEMCIDRLGVPVWLMRMSVSDPAGIERELGREAILIATLSTMETMHAHLRRSMFDNEQMPRGCVQVIDVGDYGAHGVPNWWSRMSDGFKVGSPAFKIFDANYPETTRKVFIVRMGHVTHTIHRMASPLIPARTKKKMRAFGFSAASWVDELSAELADEALLPGFLTCDSEVAFASAWPRGGLIPVSCQGIAEESEDGPVRHRAELSKPRLPSSVPAVAGVVALFLVLAAAMMMARPMSLWADFRLQDLLGKR